MGWYSTGPKIREVRRVAAEQRSEAVSKFWPDATSKCDLDIHEMVASYAPNPVLVIIDVQARVASPAVASAR